MKKNMILMSILAAALLAGCSDNDDKAAIADGTLGCSVNASGAEFVTVWNNGAWKQKEECKGSCNDGVCLSTESVCSGNASECVADITDLNDTKSLLRTCSNGEYRYTNCALLGNKVCGASGDSVACIDNAGAASKDCVDGLYRCNLAGDREYCSDGKWAKTACPQDQVCSAGECVAKPLICNEGKKVCDGLVARTCQNNAWIDQTCDEATQACVAGECVALPEGGDSCLLPNGSVFQSSCSNGTLYECVLANLNGEINYFVSQGGGSCTTDTCYKASFTSQGGEKCDSTATACLNLSSGAVCAYKNDSPLMKKVGPCTAEGEVLFVECDKDAHGVDLYAIQCVEADGVLYGNVITPESVCDGNTRISCDSQTGAVIEESCIECNYSSRFKEAQCVTENGGGNTGGGGNGSGGNGGGGDDTLYDCSAELYDNNGTTLAQYCSNKDSAYSVAVCAKCNDQNFWCQTSSEAVGQSAASVGIDAKCSGGNGNGGGNGGGGATCDYWNCGLSDSEALEDCGGDGYDSALCYIDDEDGEMYYNCLNRKTAQDASCDAGKTAWEFDGKTYCILVGEDEACLDSSGGGGATCTIYLCPDTPVEGGGTAEAVCQNQGYDSVVCDSSGAYCANRSEDEDSTCQDGEKAYTYPMEGGTTKTYCEIVGDDASCLGGGGDDTAYECSSETLSSGQTLLDACKEKNPEDVMAICVECSNNYWCAKSGAEAYIGQSLSELMGKNVCD